MLSAARAGAGRADQVRRLRAFAQRHPGRVGPGERVVRIGGVKSSRTSAPVLLPAVLLKKPPRCRPRTVQACAPRRDDPGHVDAGAEHVLVGRAPGPEPAADRGRPRGARSAPSGNAALHPVGRRWPQRPGQQPERLGSGFGLATASDEAGSAQPATAADHPQQIALTTRERHPVLLREKQTLRARRRRRSVRHGPAPELSVRS